MTRDRAREILKREARQMLSDYDVPAEIYERDPEWHASFEPLLDALDFKEPE